MVLAIIELRNALMAAVLLMMPLTIRNPFLAPSDWKLLEWIISLASGEALANVFAAVVSSSSRVSRAGELIWRCSLDVNEALREDRTLYRNVVESCSNEEVGLY